MTGTASGGPGTAVATKEYRREHLSADQVVLLTRTIAQGATEDELALFLQQCHRTGLDPFSKQIYAIKRYDSAQRKEVVAWQVSIDGLRLIADRTGKYEGQTPPQWCGQDGVWRDTWFADEPPAAARVGVRRAGFPEPLYHVVMYNEYVQRKSQNNGGGPTKFWATMPATMLAKCAESGALRKAFPNELSGLYTPEETGNDAGREEAPLPPRQEMIETQTLPGQSRSFGGWGGQPLTDCPDDTLREFVAWVNETPDRAERYLLRAMAAEEIILRRGAANFATPSLATDDDGNGATEAPAPAKPAVRPATDEQSALLAKLLKSSVFTDGEREKVGAVTGKMRTSKAIEWAQAEIKSRKAAEKEAA